MAVSTVKSTPKWVCTHIVHGLLSVVYGQMKNNFLYKKFFICFNSLCFFILQNTRLSPRQLHIPTPQKVTRLQMKGQEAVQPVQSKDSSSTVIENIEIIFSLDQRFFEQIAFHLKPHKYVHLIISECDRDALGCWPKAVYKTDKTTSWEDCNSACACTEECCHLNQLRKPM